MYGKDSLYNIVKLGPDSAGGKSLTSSGKKKKKVIIAGDSDPEEDTEYDGDQTLNQQTPDDDDFIDGGDTEVDLTKGTDLDELIDDADLDIIQPEELSPIDDDDPLDVGHSKIEPPRSRDLDTELVLSTDPDDPTTADPEAPGPLILDNLILYRAATDSELKTMTDYSGMVASRVFLQVQGILWKEYQKKVQPLTVPSWGKEIPTFYFGIEGHAFVLGIKYEFDRIIEGEDYFIDDSLRKATVNIAFESEIAANDWDNVKTRHETRFKDDMSFTKRQFRDERKRPYGTQVYSHYISSSVEREDEKDASEFINYDLENEVRNIIVGAYKLAEELGLVEGTFSEATQKDKHYSVDGRMERGLTSLLDKGNQVKVKKK